ncbi:hypothetical protein BCR42DRAFT_413327 [Absidia repens]|uniref:Uncharacterized protein n=1 Tax=Absidia repens TaxID=90262 RepID=A0A1X2IKY7_9FUNG|nr:hypothetical protein BCR42DRAFT_413327 [Absidia repens]
MTRKQKLQAPRWNTTDTDEDDSVLKSWFITVLIYLFDVVVKGLYIVKPILSVCVAVFILKTLASYGTRYMLDITCPFVPTPFLSLVPPCQHWNDPVPDFSQLVTVQEKLYKTMMDQDTAQKKALPGALYSNGNTGTAVATLHDDPTTPLTALSLKQVELATRDLQLMIKYSHLAYKDVLNTKLSEYLIHSRAFGRNIQSMHAQSKGVIDNLITYNTVTLRKLSDVEKGIISRQELRAIYEGSMELIEKEARRLILAIEVAQESLNTLEADLYSIQEITIQEKSHQRAEQPHVLADLVNMVTGKGLQRPVVRENMELLMRYDLDRSKSSHRLLLLLDRMEAVQMDLEELRTQVVAPIIIPDTLPLEMHIENINKAIERLKHGKLSGWEQDPHRILPSAPSSSSSSSSSSPTETVNTL